MEPSSASDTEEVEVPEGDADTSGTDTERKRRKQTEENIPRLVCFFNSFHPRFSHIFSLASYIVVI
jgi:hypothetical protein